MKGATSSKHLRTPPSILYHEYCVHYDVIEPMLGDFDSIAQILHVSADLLDHRIVEQVANWNGPVSVTVVLRSIEQFSCVVEFLRKIRRETPAVAQHLRAHVVSSSSWTSNCSLPSSPSTLECEEHEEATIEQIASYPANLARNVARIFSPSKYIIVTDYEHLFSEGFERRVREVASKRLAEKPQTMLVYRIFEIDEKIKELPRNKTELYRLFRESNAVVFHSQYYPGAHDIEGLSEWFEKNQTADGLFIKDKRYDRSNWEPQFVSHSRIPFHDETFPFQLRDNTVLRWEMCRANYTIDVLDDVFMVHRGIKRKANGGKSWAIQKQNSIKFARALNGFIDRMDKEYPHSKEACPTPQR